MVQLYSLLILILHTAILCSSKRPCMTWEIHHERLNLICRITGVSHPVFLFDNQGNLYARCSFFTTRDYKCEHVGRQFPIEVDISRRYINFTTAKIDDTMNGIWVCLQDRTRLTTEVSLTRGIIDSTEILITGTVLNATENNSKYILNCFSCRDPDNKNVEFLVNGRTEDSITYNNETGKCIHHKGECHPDECSCNENMFNRVFQYESKSNSSFFTCGMVFTDSFTLAIFSKLVSIVYNGKAFLNVTDTTSIIKSASWIWHETLTTDDENHIVTDLNQKQTEFEHVTEMLDYFPVDSQDVFPIAHVIAVVVAFVAGNILIIIVVYRLYKRRTSGLTQGIRGIEETTDTMSFIKNSTKSSKEPQKFTEEKYVFGEMKSRSCLGILPICGPCARQSKQRSALFLCINCEEALCGNCSRNYNVMKHARDHKWLCMNVFAKNVLFAITCAIHNQMKFQYYCDSHECLYCQECIKTIPKEQKSQLTEIDSYAENFIKTLVFCDLELRLSQCIDFLISLSTYLSITVDLIADIGLKKSSHTCVDKDRKSSDRYTLMVDINGIKIKLNTYASKTEHLLSFANEQKEVFDFIKQHGSKRQLFIMSNSLKQTMTEIDKKVVEVVKETTSLSIYDKQLQKFGVAAFATIKNIYKTIENSSA